MPTITPTKQMRRMAKQAVVNMTRNTHRFVLISPDFAAGGTALLGSLGLLSLCRWEYIEDLPWSSVGMEEYFTLSMSAIWEIRTSAPSLVISS